MNLYVVVEGKSGERIVYPKWLSIIKPNLVQVFSVSDIVKNNYFLISGNGYPRYFKIIDSAVEDCNSNAAIDVLVVAVDAEEFSYEEKVTEIFEYLRGRFDPQKLRLIVQCPCLETWALGNRIVCRRHPQDVILRQYLRMYDVREQDPELLPSLAEELNRSQSAFVYLKRMLKDRYPRLIYTKGNPRVISHEKYFRQIHARLSETGHIKSFAAFIEAFMDS